MCDRKGGGGVEYFGGSEGGGGKVTTPLPFPFDVKIIKEKCHETK